MRYEEAIEISQDVYKTDYPLLQHVYGVATLASTFCKKMRWPRLDVELAFCGGLLHDVGKTETDILHHPYIGYLMLEEYGKMETRKIEIEDVSAIALYHHQYQKNPYMNIGVLEYDKRVGEIASLVALCDKIEAGMTRTPLSPDDAVRSAFRSWGYPEAWLGCMMEIVEPKVSFLNGIYGKKG